MAVRRRHQLLARRAAIAAAGCGERRGSAVRIGRRCRARLHERSHQRLRVDQARARFAVADRAVRGRGVNPMTLPCTLPVTDRASGPPSYAAYLPPVPRPPHDAYTLLLDGRVGWRPLPGKPPVVPAPSIA